MSSKFEFEKNSQRYRWKDSKKYLSFELVETLREKAIAQSHDIAQKLTQDMLDGTITVDDWETQFAKQIKNRTIQLWQLGKPGEISLSDRGKLGNQLRFQYDKLWNFRNDILNKNLSDAQIKHRANLYFNKTRWAHEEGKRRSHYLAAFSWERRVRNALESCRQCIGYASVGWQPINSLPSVGEGCDCKANCLCHFEYSKEIVKPENNVRSIVNQLNWKWFTESNLRKDKMKIELEIPDRDYTQTELSQLVLAAEKQFLQILNEKERDRVVEQSPFNFGHPNQEQLEKINALIPMGAHSLQAAEVITCAYRASNNFVWWYPDVCAWSAKALQEMADQYKMGRPMTDDHNWGQVSLVEGIIYDAQVRKSDRVPQSVISKINEEVNRDIFQQDGYQELIICVAYEAKGTTPKDLLFRRKGSISTGGYVDTNKYKCPHDNSYFGEGEDSFTSRDGYKLPHPLLIQWFYDEEELERLAKYYLIDCVIDSVEVSHVLSGNIPEAGLLTEKG